jgi:hypothetical protein
LDWSVEVVEGPSPCKSVVGFSLVSDRYGLIDVIDGVQLASSPGSGVCSFEWCVPDTMWPGNYQIKMTTTTENVTSSLFAVARPMVNISGISSDLDFSTARKVYFPSMNYQPQCRDNPELGAQIFDTIYVQKLSFLALLTPMTSAFSFGLLAKGVESMGGNVSLVLNDFHRQEKDNFDELDDSLPQLSVDDVRGSLQGAVDYTTVGAVAAAVFDAFDDDMQTNTSFVCVFRTKEQVCSQSNLYQIKYKWRDDFFR